MSTPLADPPHAAAETMPHSLFRAVLILLATVVWFGLFAVMDIDTHHDGVMLAPAITVASGGVPFVDNFCQYGLMPPLLQGLAVKLFGGEVIVLRLLSLLFYCGTALLLDKLTRRFLPTKWNWIVLFSFWMLLPDMIVTSHPWSSIFALFFMLWELDLLLGFLENGSRKKLVSSGICAFLAFASRHPCGIVTLIAALLTLAISAMTGETGKRMAVFRKNGLLYAAGFLGAALPAALYLTIMGAWHDYLVQCWGFILGFVWRRGGAGNFRQIGESFFPLTGQNWLFDAIFSALPLTAMLMFWGAIRRVNGDMEKMKKEIPLIALLMLGLGSWHQYYPVPCIRHLYWGAIPLLIPYAIAIRRTYDAGKKQRLLALFLVLLLILAAAVRLFAGGFRLASLKTRQKLDLPCVRGLYLSRRDAAQLRFWHDLLNEMPEDLRKKGIVNLTQEAFWQNFYPQCAKHHPIPMRMIECPYPDRDEVMLRFAIANGCAIFTDIETLTLPGYTCLAEGPCNLHQYRMLVPTEYYDKIMKKRDK